MRISKFQNKPEQHQKAEIASDSILLFKNNLNQKERTNTRMEPVSIFSLVMVQDLNGNFCDGEILPKSAHKACVQSLSFKHLFRICKKQRNAVLFFERKLLHSIISIRKLEQFFLVTRFRKSKILRRVKTDANVFLTIRN